METRQYGKFHITRIDRPDGTGHSYVDMTQPGGMIEIIDFKTVPLDVLLKICGWEAEPQTVKPRDPKDPVPNFNTFGWRF